MIEFLDIEIEHFESIIDKIKYDFRTGFTRIEGPNGVGKSSIFQALFYAVTGKPYKDIKVGSLVNRKAKKNMLVVFRFQKKENLYIVKRGIKPDIFEIYLNDSEKPIEHDSKNKTYQQVLFEIMETDEKSFHNIFKTKTRFQSFLSLKKEDKRQFVDKALNTTVLAEMRNLLLGEISILESDVSILQNDEKNKKYLIESEEKHIETLKNSNKVQFEERKMEIETIITKNKNDLEIKNKELTNKGNLDKLKKLKELKVKIDDQISQLSTNRQKLENEITVSLKKTEIFRTKCGNCPKIKEFEGEDRVEEKKVKILEFEKSINEWNEKLSVCNEKIKEFDTVVQEIAVLKTDIRRLEMMIQDDSLRLKSIELKLVNLNETIDLENLDKYKKELIDTQAQINEKTDDLDNSKILNNLLLKDNGIRAYLIRKYLDFINERLNFYLSKFRLNLLFLFDDNFDEVIIGKFHDGLEFNNLSEGEKKRIDLSILFSFLDLDLETMGQKFNFLLFDETLSGVDVDSVPLLMEILEEKSKTMEIVIIEHNPAISCSYFDRIIQLSKDTHTKMTI